MPAPDLLAILKAKKTRGSERLAASAAAALGVGTEAPRPEPVDQAQLACASPDVDHRPVEQLQLACVPTVPENVGDKRGRVSWYDADGHRHRTLTKREVCPKSVSLKLARLTKTAAASAKVEEASKAVAVLSLDTLANKAKFGRGSKV